MMGFKAGETKDNLWDFLSVSEQWWDLKEKGGPFGRFMVSSVSEQWWDLKEVGRVDPGKTYRALANNDGI